MDYGKTIKQGTRWTYVGPDGTAGLRHTVVGVGKGIATWSDPVSEPHEFSNPINDHGRAISGFSWYGPAVEFLKQFKAD